MDEWLDGGELRLAGYNPTGDFYLTYDRRPRIDSFKFMEYASAANGGTPRVFKARFGYSPDGQATLRSATVARNGSVLDLNDGTDIAISAEEAKQWIDNYNYGDSSVGPPANRQGKGRLLGDNLLGTSTVCGGCHFSAGLIDGSIRAIAMIYRLMQHPVVRSESVRARKRSRRIGIVSRRCASPLPRPRLRGFRQVEWHPSTRI